MLPKFEISLPETLDEALILLSSREGVAPICGGTDILVRLRAGACSDRHLVAIDRLAPLNRLEVRDGVLFIGAACRLARLAESEQVKSYAPLLAQGCREIGSPAIRNRGTIGGNVENASPAGDALTALYGECAQVVLVSRRGERILPIEDYIIGPRRTRREQDELICGFLIRPKDRDYRHFFKVGRRNALAISVVNGCVSVSAEGGVLKKVDIVLGAVAPTPVRLEEAAAQISGNAYTKEFDQKVQKLVEKAIHPIDDIRASKEYRRYIAGVSVRRGLRAAADWGCN